MKIERSFLLTSVLVLLAGCGGSSGGGGSTSGSAGPGGPTTVTFSFSSETPNVVAAKVGSSSFMAQALSSGKLSLSIPSGTMSFAVAYVCSTQSFPTIESIFEATIVDGTSFTLPCLAPISMMSIGDLTGKVDASVIPGANLVKIAANNGSQWVVGAIAPDTNFSVAVPAGADRVEVLAYNSDSQGLLATSTLVAARNFDHQTVPGSLNGGSQVVLGTADRTTFESLAYSDVPAGYSAPSTIVDLIMSGVGGFTFSESTSQYPALPPGAIENGDTYEFLARCNSDANPTEAMTVAKSFSNAGPVSFTFPPPWSYSGPTPAALPAFNFAYSGFTGNAGVNNLVLISWGFPTATQIETTASANYQNGSTTVTIPDLSGLTGFVPAPPSGTQVIWVGLISQNNLGIQKPIGTKSTITTVENSGSYMVP